MRGRSLCGLTPTHGPVSLPQASSEKPKRPISAMFIFSEEKRKQLQEERPELSESELTRLLARMWNDLSEKKKVGTVPDPFPSLSPLLRWASRAVRGTLPVLVLLQGALLAPGQRSSGMIVPGSITAPASHHPGAGVDTDGCRQLCPLPLMTWWVKTQQLKKPWRVPEPQFKALIVFLVGESLVTWVCMVGDCRCYRGDSTGGSCSVLLPALPVLGGPGARGRVAVLPVHPRRAPLRRPSTKRGRRR